MNDKKLFLLLFVLCLFLSIPILTVKAEYDIVTDLAEGDNALGHPGQKKGFYDVLDNLYVFDSDGIDLAYEYSLDSGINWSIPITVRSCPYGRFFSVDYGFGYVWVVVGSENASGLDYYITRGVIETDHTITFEYWRSKDWMINGAFYPTIAIGSDYCYVAYVGYASLSWGIAMSRWNHALTSETTTNVANGKQYCIAIALIEDNDIFIVTQDINGRPSYVGAWGGAVTNFALNADPVSDGDIIAISDGSDVYCMALDTNHYDFYKLNNTFYDLGEFFTDTLSTDSLGCLSLDIVGANYQLDIFYFVNDVLYKRVADSLFNSWGSTAQLEDETALGYLQDNVNSVYYSDSNGNLGVFYTANTIGAEDRLSFTGDPYPIPPLPPVEPWVLPFIVNILPYCFLLALAGIAIVIVKGRHYSNA